MNNFTKFQIILVSLLISISTFFGGYYLGKRGFEYEIKKNPPYIVVLNKFPEDQELDFSLFWEVWDLVQANHLDRPLNASEMMYGAIKGMVSAVGDPYTSFLPPEENETVTSALNGSYQGIGAELGFKDDQLIIVSPLDGSPAEEAGVRPGDKILKIEEEGTFGITLNEAVAKIRGQAGTISTLTLQRGEGEPFVVRIKRGVITIESVTWEDKGDGTAYIRVSRFGADTNADWARVVSEVNTRMEELDVIILDLRGNPGGYLQSSVYIAEEFYRGAPVLYQESATGEQIPFNAERVGTFDKVPLVIVLIDEGSASASEILAAALKSNINVTLLGKKSFGKGTIQDAKDFGDGSGVHITVAKWLTPEKVWVHNEGITPDVEVEITEENIEDGYDSQLETAVELAKEI
jgi:carboxyl-terminal processing protease